ncbi:general substrate transporter [Cadophora sp. MPI-SDFR-AT-0126]|nr:general substrate transporter [Leotiomycetes sp. MPI-SDFR-AT-0126]
MSHDTKDMSPEVEQMEQAPSYVESTSRFDDHALAQRGTIMMEEERSLGVWETTKLHWRALLICTVSFTAGMLFGYDTVVNGASISMPAFFIYFGDIGPTGPYLPSKWTSLWTAMSALAQAFGAFFVGFILDRFGRKWPAVGAGALTMIGTAVQYTSVSRGSLLAGKMVVGLGIGAAMATATSYASEVAPIKLRAPIQSGLVLFTVFMQGVALGIIRTFVPNIHPIAFRHVFAIQWAFGGLLMIVFALTQSTSPIFLINNGRLGKAHSVMTRIYGNKDDVDARLAYLIKTIREEKSNHSLESGTYFECFKSKDLKRTLTVIFLYTASNWGGAAFLAQSIYFLIIAGLPAIHAFDVSIGGFGLACIIIVSSWFIMNKISRRIGFIAGCIINFVIMLIVGALYYSPGNASLWAIAVLMNVLISLQTSLLQGLGWPIAAELSSYRLRGKTMSIAIVMQTFSTWLTTFIVPYIYNVDSGNLGARTGFIFAGTSLLLIVGAFFLVPETMSMTIEEIDIAYERRIPARRIKKGVVTVDVDGDLNGAGKV